MRLQVDQSEDQGQARQGLQESKLGRNTGPNKGPNWSERSTRNRVQGMPKRDPKKGPIVEAKRDCDSIRKVQ